MYTYTHTYIIIMSDCICVRYEDDCLFEGPTPGFQEDLRLPRPRPRKISRFHADKALKSGCFRRAHAASPLRFRHQTPCRAELIL